MTDLKNPGILYKFADTYVWDSLLLFTWEMHYDANGQYIGQRQDDAMGEGSIFFYAEMIEGVPCVNGNPVPPLTQEEMEGAIK